jgi:hypothetical protein
MWLFGSSLDFPSNFGISYGNLVGIGGQLGSWNMDHLSNAKNLVILAYL